MPPCHGGDSRVRIPYAPQRNSGVVQLVRAPPCHGGSWGFESPRHCKTNVGVAERFSGRLKPYDNGGSIPSSHTKTSEGELQNVVIAVIREVV